MIAGALKNFVLRSQFAPSRLGIFVNPYYFARRGLYLAMRGWGKELGGKLLDVGCGSKPYRELCRATEYIGLEIDSPEARARGYADFFYQGDAFPFPDASFDSALANQVLEHVFQPEAFVAEIRRVLKPGGKVLLTVPFVWEEHEQPRDFARYTSFGLRALLERNGFEILVQEKSVTGARALLQVKAGCLFRAWGGKNNYWNFALTLALIAPLQILGRIIAALLPAYPEIYLDNVVLARRR